MRYGVTGDTGGHVAYVLDAAAAQARLADVSKVTIVTRRFDEPSLDRIHLVAHEPVSPKLDIRRISDSDSQYLDKSQLLDRLPELADSLAALLAGMSPRVDVIHAHFADAAWIAGQMARRLSIPFVYTPHSLGIDKARCLPDTVAGYGQRVAQERHAIASADGIIVSSLDEAQRQVPNYGVCTEGRLEVIEPGAPVCAAADASAARYLLATLLNDPTRPIVLAVARPVRRKNLVALAEAFADCPALSDRANLVIIAGDHHSPRLDDEERDTLRALRHVRDRLPGRFALPPRHDRALVQSLYAAAAESGGVFVNPALHEPFGLTLLEAAQAGLPVVATCHGGPVEIVASIGHGLLVDPNVPADIATACLGIIDDPDAYARFAEAGRRHSGRLDWTRYAQRSRHLYRRLCRDATATHRRPEQASTLPAGAA
ncbi:glycosyltransferase [Endobacter medicaginis]|uniref:glycosyltransferase n=1 Tax=Endobacter medicaginis TaxID=1181271 RepID=UPI001C400B91|nr:glycosyltransferase [Endobacter medicaginis]